MQTSSINNIRTAIFPENPTVQTSTSRGNLVITCQYSTGHDLITIIFFNINLVPGSVFYIEVIEFVEFQQQTPKARYTATVRGEAEAEAEGSPRHESPWKLPE